MSNILKGLNENRSSWDSNMPGYQGDYGGAENWGRRNKASDENDAIDARLRQQDAQRREYEQNGQFWLKLKDSQRHLPAGPFVGKQAANAAAIDLLKKQPELKGNLVITAYGPDEKLDELSSGTLANYKKAAGADASKSDRLAQASREVSDTEMAQKLTNRANKRFSGIVKATKKEFDNDAKGVAEGQLDESNTIDFIRGLISEFNTQMSGSPYYPMDYKNPGMRMWTRGDGSRYKDPGYIFIDRDLKPEDQPKWHKAKAVEKFWKFLESKGARKIGDVSGEFGSDSHSPAVVLNKLIFVFNGRSIAWGSTSRLKNSSVWRQKQQGVAESAQTEGEATLAKIAASGDDGYEMIYDGLNGLLGTEAQIILQDMYDDISIEHRLHPDDDFELIQDRMMDRIENDYGVDEGMVMGVSSDASSAGTIAEYDSTKFGSSIGKALREEKCPECGGPMFSDLMLAEKKDACYNKVRSRYKVWPSAYASGALVQCRKKGAANWGNKSKNEDVAEGYKDDSKEREENLRYARSRNPVADEIRKKLNPNQKPEKEQGMAEGVNDYLWHGSRNEHEILYPRQANDTGGKEESNKNAIYATPNAKVAIAMGLTTPGSDTGMFPNDPQMVLFKGGIRKGQMVYLHKVPKDLFIKHNGREWYSKPEVTEIKPLEVKAIPVDKYLNLIRQATPQDLELQKKYTKQGVAEGAEQEKPIKKSDWFDPTDMRSPEKQKAAYLNHLAAKKKNKNIKEQGVAEGSIAPDVTVNKVHDDGHEKEWHVFRGKEMIGYVIKNQPDTAEGLYIAYGHGPGRAFVEEFRGLKSAVNYITSLKEGVAEEQLDEKCWDTHKQVGMKNKGGRMVPNCVPKESAIMKGLKL